MSLRSAAAMLSGNWRSRLPPARRRFATDVSARSASARRRSASFARPRRRRPARRRSSASGRRHARRSSPSSRSSEKRSVKRCWRRLPFNSDARKRRWPVARPRRNGDRPPSLGVRSVQSVQRRAKAEGHPSSVPASGGSGSARPTRAATPLPPPVDHPWRGPSPTTAPLPLLAPPHDYSLLVLATGPAGVIVRRPSKAAVVGLMLALPLLPLASLLGAVRRWTVETRDAVTRDAVGRTERSPLLLLPSLCQQRGHLASGFLLI